MTDQEQHELDELYKEAIKLYFAVKRLIVKAEREDAEQRISLSAIAELRSALDHVMRAHSISCGVGSLRPELQMEPSDYCRKNLDKAIGHLYRAGYDAYDILSIRLIEDIEKCLNDVSSEAIYHVIPTASEQIMRPLIAAKQMLEDAKMEKDVETREEEEKGFMTYKEGTEQLETIRNDVLTHRKEIGDVEAELRRKEAEREAKEGRRFKKSVAIGFGFTLFGTILGWILSVVTASP